MAKHAHVSRYYADDKDVADLVSQSAIKSHQLAAFLRERGIVVSNSLSREDLIRYFRFLPLAWPEFDSLVTRLDRPDREEKHSSCRINAQIADIPAILERLETIKEARGLRLAEVHKATVVSPNVIELNVQYTETDPSKTRALQRRERQVTIRIEKVGDVINVRHHDNERAREIVAKLEEAVAPTTPQASRREVIDVSGLSSAQRDDFFTRMARSIPGYELDDVHDLKVERMDTSAPDEPGDDAEVEPDKAAEADFQGIVKKAVLSGTGLLFSEDYQRYSSGGFAISKMVWTIRETSNASDVVELMAECRGENGAEFRYDAVGKYPRLDDGLVSQHRVPIRGPDKQRFLELLEGSAFSTLSTIRSPAQSSGASGQAS